jgi:hypothetical protein
MMLGHVQVEAAGAARWGTSGSMSVLVEAAQEAFQSEYVDPDGVQQRAPLAQTAGGMVRQSGPRVARRSSSSSHSI